MKNKCSGLIGLIFGHKYRARYSTEEALPEGLNEMMGRITQAQSLRPGALKRAMMEKKEYQGDVCVRCGAEANR